MSAPTIHIHYAFQSCDIKSYQDSKRYCGDDRTLLSKKSIRSFLQSVSYCVEKVPNTVHTIAIFDDDCSEDLRAFHQKCIDQFSCNNIQIEVIKLPKQPNPKQGIADSIRECYLWLQDNGRDFVYQIQDDYMFVDEAIYEMLDVWQQMYRDTQTEAIIGGWNDPDIWAREYRYRATPRTIVPGKHRYWIQSYDCACTFLTSHSQFSKHWDLYTDFFYLIPKLDETDGMLENKSLNYMFVKRGVLMLVPMSSVSWHMQVWEDEDPYIPWRPIWDAIDVS